MLQLSCQSTNLTLAVGIVNVKKQIQSLCNLSHLQQEYGYNAAEASMPISGPSLYSVVILIPDGPQNQCYKEVSVYMVEPVDIYKQIYKSTIDYNLVKIVRRGPR